MEKVGLIAESFTERIREICNETENSSDGQFRIGYCYSAEALNFGKEHSDYLWAEKRNIDLPDRIQELMRNCDFLLLVFSSNDDMCTLSLMSSRGTFILTDGNIDETVKKKLYDTASEYGTRISIGNLNEDDTVSRIIRFYRGEE